MKPIQACSNLLSTLCVSRYGFSLGKRWSKRSIAEVCVQINMTYVAAMVVLRTVHSMPFSSFHRSGRSIVCMVARHSNITWTVSGPAGQRRQTPISDLTRRTRHLGCHKCLFSQGNCELWFISRQRESMFIFLYP